MEKRDIELFCGYLGEAIFLAVALGIFSIMFKNNFINAFLNHPLNFNDDNITEFYILLTIGTFFLFSHAIIKTRLKKT